MKRGETEDQRSSPENLSSPRSFDALVTRAQALPGIEHSSTTNWMALSDHQATWSRKISDQDTDQPELEFSVTVHSDGRLKPGSITTVLRSVNSDEDDSEPIFFESVSTSDFLDDSLTPDAQRRFNLVERSLQVAEFLAAHETLAVTQ